MQPEALFPTVPKIGLPGRVPQAWRAPLILLALAWLALLALTSADWLAMAVLWWNISTYNHILFVPVIVGWLVWHRRGELAR
ncbi:MAG: exosortase A, partial [Erythrobacter cryptus]